MASSWLTNVLYEQPDIPTPSATSSATTPAFRISVIAKLLSTTLQHTYHDPLAPPPPLRPPPNPPKPPPPPPPNPPNPPPNPPPRPPNPPPNGPTPLLQPLHGPPPQRRRPRRPRRPAMPLMMMKRTTSEMMRFPPEPLPDGRRRSRVARGAPGIATLRPSPMRPMMRCTPATSPAPYAPCRKRGAIS